MAWKLFCLFFSFAVFFSCVRGFSQDAILETSLDSQKLHAVFEKLDDLSHRDSTFANLFVYISSLENSAPLQDVIELLNKIRDDILSEQNAADEQNEVETVSCKERALFIIIIIFVSLY